MLIQDAFVAILCIVICTFLVCLFRPVTLSPPTPPPPEAVAIGPDNYMWVWADKSRVRFIFRNMPRVTICFDRRAAVDFGKWLQALSKDG